MKTTRKTQTESLLKITQFFNINVSFSKHKSLNSPKGIIKDRTLKGETEEDILKYFKPQGVTAVKRFKIKKRLLACGNKHYLINLQFSKFTNKC